MKPENNNGVIMPAKKATATKKKTSTAKKPVKKTTAKSQAATKPKKVTNKKQPSQQSFHKCPETQPFMTFKITSQTVYWLIICVLVFLVGIWLIKMQNDIMSLYDQVDAMRAEEQTLDIRVHKLLDQQAKKAQ